jgi:protein-arginine kinase activator protein McsA
VFEEYQALFAQSVHRSMEQVENVRSQHKVLTEERFVSLAKDRLAEQQIEQTEQQLQAAVEAEDYELADQLGQVVEGHKREKHEVGLMLENISKALDQLESQKVLVIKSVATCFDNLAVRLEELKEKEAALEQKDDEETLKQFASISKQLSAEQERLQQDLKHLERDEQLVAEERKELEDSIKEQTGEIELQKDAVSAKLDEVQKEIDELRKLLEKKQKEAAALRTEMFGFEDSISRVRVKFSRQLTRVDKKERALKESRSEWELEDASHKKQKEAHELQVQSHSEALLAHDALLKTLNSELQLSKKFCELIPEQLGFMDDEKKGNGQDQDGDEGDLAQLQADVVKCEAAVSEAKIILKAAMLAITNLQSEYNRLVARIPELESLKKDAAAKRDFKSASKASKEIKDATTRIKECEEELNGEAASKKKAAEEELNRMNEELVRTRELANEKEKMSGLEKMAALAKKIAQLIEKKKEICGDCSSNVNTVRGVGALVLEGQVKALKAEGQDLGSKYGGWKELMKDIQVEDDDPEGSRDDEEEKQKTEIVKEEKPSSPSPGDGLTIEERVEKLKGLIAKMKEVEQQLETAVAQEDFENASELQDQIDSLASEIANIDVPDDILEQAVSGDPSDDDPDSTVEAAAETETEVVEDFKEEEEKKDTSDEETAPIDEDMAQEPEVSKDEGDEEEEEYEELENNLEESNDDPEPSGAESTDGISNEGQDESINADLSMESSNADEDLVVESVATNDTEDTA